MDEIPIFLSSYLAPYLPSHSYHSDDSTFLTFLLFFLPAGKQASLRGWGAKQADNKMHVPLHTYSLHAVYTERRKTTGWWPFWLC